MCVQCRRWRGCWESMATSPQAARKRISLRTCALCAAPILIPTHERMWSRLSWNWWPRTGLALQKRWNSLITSATRPHWTCIRGDVTVFLTSSPTDRIGFTILPNPLYSPQVSRVQGDAAGISSYGRCTPHWRVLRRYWGDFENAH